MPMTPSSHDEYTRVLRILNDELKSREYGARAIEDYRRALLALRARCYSVPAVA